LPSVGPPLLDVQPDLGRHTEVPRAERHLIQRLHQLHKRHHPHELQLGARIATYDLAARLQLEASDALDIGKETAAVREMYDVGQEPTDSYGRRCLMARRLVDRKSTRLNFSHVAISYAVFCLKKKRNHAEVVSFSTG